MGNYILYLDLLGIKDLARYSSEKYFSAMEDFRNQLIVCASIFNEAEYSGNSRIYFFSDSAFMESDDLKTVFTYLINLRLALNRINLFFTAAVTVGELNAHNFNGEDLSRSNINNSTKRLIAGKEKYLRGTIFQSKDISRVYVLQNAFKGIGVFVHEGVFNKLEKDSIISIRGKDSNGNSEKIINEISGKINSFKEEYIIPSFFFPSINTNNAYDFYDLKLTKDELDIALYEIIIQRYHNSNIKNKKYGRFYLSHFANWISSTDFSKIETKTENGEFVDSFTTPEMDLFTEPIVFENQPVIFNKLIMREDVLISELKKTAHCFEFLYFFLLDRLYNQFGNYNLIISQTIQTINKIPKCRSHLTKIDDIPNCVLSLENKDRFIKDYNKVLNALSANRERTSQIRREKIIQAKKTRADRERSRSVSN